jgi:arginase
MILFFPQWQGAGQGNRIDEPARLLMDALRPSLDMQPISEIALDPSSALELEHGIWGRTAILSQLTAARDLLAENAPDRIFTVGGDCGIEVIPVAYLNGRYDDFALVWLDGHADLNTPETSPSGTFHGMPLRVLMGEGDSAFTALVSKPLTPRQVIMGGVRDLDPAERDYIEGHGILNLPVGTPDIAARLVAELKRRSIQHIYIHFDLDALDPAAAPVMHYPAADGFTLEVAAGIVEALAASFAVAGMSITEYDSLDSGGPASIAPLLEIFARMARQEA